MSDNKEVYKVHVSFEAVYYVEAGSLAEATELLKNEQLGDNLRPRNVSLLHICTEAELEAIKEKGLNIISSTMSELPADTNAAEVIQEEQNKRDIDGIDTD